MKMTCRCKQIFCVALAFAWLLSPLAAEPDAGPLVVKDRSGERVGMYRHSYALVLAVDEYADLWPARPGALQEAGELKRVLENLGFDVTLAMNPETRSLRKLLVDFINRYGQAEDNRLLIYFSGYCYNLVPQYGADEMQYLVPAGTPDPGKNLVRFRESSLSFFHVDIYARNIRSNHALFLFEGCGKGDALALRDGGDSKEITRLAFNPVRQFILFGGPEEPGADSRRASPGSRLIAALKGEADANADGYVTGSELARFLRRENREHPGKQEPLIYGKLQGVATRPGDFVFPLALPPDKPRKLPAKTIVRAHLPKAPVSEKAEEVSLVKPGPMQVPGPLPSSARTDSVAEPPPAVAEHLTEEKHDRLIFWPPDEAERKTPLAIQEETFSRLQDLQEETFLEKPPPADSSNKPGGAMRPK